MARSPARVRAARLTDLAALGELSRLAQHGTEGARSLGLPLSGPPIGVFSLFRLRLGAFRPHDLLYVYERGGHLAGLVRCEIEGTRDEWTIVELDAVGGPDAGDVRFRLVGQLLRDAARRGAARVHVACADADDNVELFMQAGFARYGEEQLLHRPADRPLPEPWSEEAAAAAGIRPADPLDAPALARLHVAVTPPPVERLEALRLHDWERPARDWRIPRSSLAPLLRLAALEAWVLEAPGGGPDGTTIDAVVQVGVAQEDQPHYLKVLARPDADAATLISFALGVVAARTAGRQAAGVVAPVRTYEAPVDRRLEEAGFAAIATVTLLVKETLVRVAEPRLVPAGVR